MLITITELLILINAKKMSMVEKFSGKFNSQDRKRNFCYRTGKPLPKEAKETIRSQMVETWENTKRSFLKVCLSELESSDILPQKLLYKIGVLNKQ